MWVVISMANINNTSSYMDEDKKQTGRFKRFYKEMQIADLQKELDQMDKEE